MLIEAYRLRKYTSCFDQDLGSVLIKHLGAPIELKPKAFINGRCGKNTVSADDRKRLLTDMSALAGEVSSIHGFGVSFASFNAADVNGLTASSLPNPSAFTTRSSTPLGRFRV